MKIAPTLLILLLILISSCTKCSNRNGSLSDDYIYPGENRRWISRYSGLSLHIRPDENSKEIGSVPFGAMIEIGERTKQQGTVDEISDYWYKVVWKKKSGWLFSGYLSYYRLPTRPEHEALKKLPSEWVKVIEENGELFRVQTYIDETSDGGLIESITIRSVKGAGPSIDHISTKHFVEYLVTDVKQESGNFIITVINNQDLASDPVEIISRKDSRNGLTSWLMPGSDKESLYCTSQTANTYSIKQIKATLD